MFILSVYMRGATSTRRDLNDGTDCYDKLFDKLAEVCERGSKVLIVGDMNAHTNEESEIILSDERQADDCNNNNMYVVDDVVQPLNDLYI